METIIINLSAMPDRSSMMQEIGYEPETTFWSDFSIADRWFDDIVDNNAAHMRYEREEQEA